LEIWWESDLFERFATIKAVIGNQGDSISNGKACNVTVGEGTFSNRLEICWGFEILQGSAFVEASISYESH
jgi:hypothetical protein